MRLNESYLQKRTRVLDLICFWIFRRWVLFLFMENFVALIKPKLTSAEKKIIAMVIDGLPSENSRRAYQRALEEFFFWHGVQNRPIR